jgi:hypothetical protein
LLRRVLLSSLVALALAPAARAADPIMPLTQVRPGMQCVGLSVVRGTAISQFNVEVLDVIGAQAGLSGPRLLVRASGPAVDATGIGPGFSGSPILCPGAGGVSSNAGAISESVGEYGNHVVLVTPIEEMLRDPPATPPAASAGARNGLARSALPLAGVLTVSGLSPRTRDLLARAAHRAGTAVLAAPAGPLGGFPRQELVPGASVAATLSTGDIALGAVGTVTYRDGARIWAFGHAFEGLGPRSLFLEDAYVFGVISNPFTLPDFGAGTYKLTSAGGHLQGTVSSDAVASIAGTVGDPPAAIPLRVIARETGGAGGPVRLDSQLADERTLGFGAGLSFAAPLGASQALEQLLRNFGPATVSMCFRIKLAGRRKELGYCNPYFDAFTPLDDLIAATSLVDAFDLPPPAIERASVSIRARRGVRSDVLISARAPHRVVGGQRIRVRVTVQRRSGGRRTLSVPVRIPRDLRPGPRTLLVSGTSGGAGSAEESFLLAFAEVFDEFGGGAEPRTTGELARRIAAVHQDEGISARIRRGDQHLVHRSDAVSFEGRVRVRLVVRRARR